jgi:hypothetical protein
MAVDHSIEQIGAELGMDAIVGAIWSDRWMEVQYGGS